MKSHVGPNGAGKCTAKEGNCPFGGDDVHFDNIVQARAAYEKIMEQKPAAKFGSISKAQQFALDLQTRTPVDIDENLAEFYYKQSVAADTIDQHMDSIETNKKNLERTIKQRGDIEYWTKSYRASIEKSEALIPVLEKNLAELQKISEPYDNEFKRRGGWTRSFLVSNMNGHAHKRMNCSTCFPTTRFQWMTSYSGKTEAEIVEAAGYRACTVCYPTAPVDTSSRSHPTKMFTVDEEEAQKRREEKAIVKSAKDEKARAAAIFTKDGEPLMVPTFYSSPEHIKTERSARILATDAVSDLEQLKYFEETNQYVNPNSLEKANKQLEVIIPALAAKNGVSEKEMREEIDKKGKAKWDRQLAEWAKSPYNPNR